MVVEMAIGDGAFNGGEGIERGGDCESDLEPPAPPPSSSPIGERALRSP
jgi:hypothetical protein